MLTMFTWTILIGLIVAIVILALETNGGTFGDYSLAAPWLGLVVVCLVLEAVVATWTGNLVILFR